MKQRAGRVRCSAKLGAGRPARRVLRLVLDGEKDNRVVVLGVKDGIRKLRREGAMNAGKDLGERSRTFCDVYDGLADSGSETFRDHLRLTAVPRSRFRELGARFRADYDSSLHSVPKIS